MSTGGLSIPSKASPDLRKSEFLMVSIFQELKQYLIQIQMKVYIFKNLYILDKLGTSLDINARCIAFQMTSASCKVSQYIGNLESLLCK